MSSNTIKARLTSEADSIYAASISHFESAIEPEPNNRIRFLPRIIILMAIFIPFILGRFRCSFFTLFLLAYAVDFVYNRRIKKFTRSMNNMVYREALRMKAINNYESVEWMNHIISRVWGVVEAEVSRQVIARVNILLQEKTPQFISSLKLSSFTLGSSAPAVLGITHFEEVDAESICIEAEFCFVPMEIGKDAYHYVTKKRGFEWNSKVILTARLGTKVRGVGVDLPILVKQISFKGRMRVVLKLCRERIIKSLEVMFTEKPEIDFDLVPLKTVDLMDVPGLSKWIGLIIDTALKSMVNPNSVIVDLTKPIKKEVIKGVLALRISNMIMKENDTVEIEIGIDGRKLYHTAKKTGSNVYFNEYFFLILRESDETLFLRVGNNNTNYGEGKICMKLIFQLGRHCEAVRIMKKGNIRGVVNCSFRLYDAEDSLMDKVATEIVPLKTDEHKESRAVNGVFDRTITSAIINLKVIQCEDLRGLNYSRKKVYSPLFTLLASPKIETQIEEESPFSFVTGPVNATAFLIGGALSTATNVLGMTNKQETLPSSTSTFFFYESKIAPDTNSPLYNEQEQFFSRDIQKDYLYIRVIDTDNSEVIGTLDLKMDEIKNEESWHRLKNAQRGRIKLCTEVKKIKIEVEDFVEYKRALWICIKNISSIYTDAVMYGIVKSGSDRFYIEPFCTGDLQNNRNIILPVNDEATIMIYKMGDGVDDLIGESIIKPEDYLIEEKVDEKDKRIDRNPKSSKNLDNYMTPNTELDSDGIKLPLIYKDDENGSIQTVIKTSPLIPYRGTSAHKAFKVVQVRFTRFYNMKEEFLVEFKTATETMRKSSISRNFALSERFILCVGDCEIRAIFKSAAIGINKIIGDCLIPKRAMKERVMLDEGQVSVDVEIRVQSCDFPFFQLVRIGILELLIMTGIDLPGDCKTKCNPFVKLFLNGSRIHKTAQKKATLNPEWNENVHIKINSMVDILRFEVFDWNQFEKNKLVAFREIPLYFLTEGKSEFEVRLMNSETFKPDNGKLKIAFRFHSEEPEKNSKVKTVLKT